MVNNLEVYLEGVCKIWQENKVECAIRFPTDDAAGAVPRLPIGILVRNNPNELKARWTIIGVERIFALPDEVMKNFNGSLSMILATSSRENI